MSETYEQTRSHLRRLAGLPCPLCRIRGLEPERLTWTGTSLACPRGHGWNNPEALVAELREAHGGQWGEARGDEARARGGTPE